jgi:hypothetical protein
MIFANYSPFHFLGEKILATKGHEGPRRTTKREDGWLCVQTILENPDN